MKREVKKEKNKIGRWYIHCKPWVAFLCASMYGPGHRRYDIPTRLRTDRSESDDDDLILLKFPLSI